MTPPPEAPPWHRTIGNVADALRDGHDKQQPATLLIGAGCSRSAGIPLARELVGLALERYKKSLAGLDDHSYPAVMARLNTGARYQLIGDSVKRAKLNWAHVLIAWLIQQGYVGRVLTTNFDNLLLRACALFGVNPAIYDMTSGELRAELIQDPAIFYLHGQYRGFVQFHKQDEVTENAKKLEPLFVNYLPPRPWIAVGYSGECDPVFERVAAVPQFTEGLYWVTYGNEMPNDDVRTRLFSDPSNRRQAYLVSGYDADGFFAALIDALGLPWPLFLRDPFGHMLSLLEPLADNPASTMTGAVDDARLLLQRAKVFLQVSPSSATEVEAEKLALAVQAMETWGDYAAVLRAIQGRENLPKSTEFRKAVAWAYVERATRTGSEADFDCAVTISPCPHDVQIQWAAFLARRALTSQRGDRAALLESTAAHYRAALEQQADSQRAIYGLACVSAWRGEVDETIRWLKAMRAVAPAFSPNDLVGEPGFQDVLSGPEAAEFMSEWNRATAKGASHA